MAGIGRIVDGVCYAWNRTGNAFAPYNIGDFVTIRLYPSLGCQNVQIVNIDNDGSYFVKEVFKDISIVPKCFKISGWSIVKQVVHAIEQPSDGVVLSEITPLTKNL